MAFCSYTFFASGKLLHNLFRICLSTLNGAWRDKLVVRGAFSLAEGAPYKEVTMPEVGPRCARSTPRQANSCSSQVTTQSTNLLSMAV